MEFGKYLGSVLVNRSYLIDGEVYFFLSRDRVVVFRDDEVFLILGGSYNVRVRWIFALGSLKFFCRREDRGEELGI